VAGPVIQATGKSTFEDGLRAGGSCSDFQNSSAPHADLMMVRSYVSQYNQRAA
jgi:hypothetical protein